MTFVAQASALANVFPNFLDFVKGAFYVPSL